MSERTDIDKVRDSGFILGAVAAIVWIVFSLAIHQGYALAPIGLAIGGFIFVFNFIIGFSFEKKTATNTQHESEGSKFRLNNKEE